MHTSICVDIKFLFLLGRNQGVELLGRVVNFYLNFKETALLFSTEAVPLYISTSSVWVPFAHSHQHVL